MPLNRSEVLGTEKDASKNHVYCKYCYNEGKFTNPDMTLEEMKLHLRQLMQKMNIDNATIEIKIMELPWLSRWLSKTPINNQIAFI